MKIKKVLSNNAALALDDNQVETVVLGAGVGWNQKPGDEVVLEHVERTFYDLDSRYLDMVAGLPKELLFAGADIGEQAEMNLGCPLNPNLPITLADHLNFALERTAKGMELPSPLAYDVKHLFPKEYELGELALDIVQDYVGIRLPDTEAVNIALHLVNGEAESSDVHSVMMSMKIISDINAIVERELKFTLDQDSFHYSRFVTHLRYLIQRLSAGTPIENTGGSMLNALSREYPDVYLCARKVEEYFKTEWQWQCSKDEILYLMLHINRVKEKTEPQTE